MDTGVAIFPTQYSIGPGALAALVEERGQGSLWFPEHTHIPASRDTPPPSGGELPPRYSHSLDLFVAMTAAATATRRLRVGAGICLVVERDPIITAKEVATIDQLSGGRVEFGVGAGWNREEMANHGTDFTRRFGVMRERVEAIKAIWTQEEASYHGEHVDFERIWCWPKPLQEGGPPVLVGGHGRKVLERVVAFGDELMPNRIGDDEKIAARIVRLREAGEAAGRGPLGTTLANASREPEVIEHYARAGVHRFLFWLRQGDAADAERRLDRIAAAAEAHARAG